jgi:Histone-like transcription factor (CBF/NF-Y) and archaeal histone
MNNPQGPYPSEMVDGWMNDFQSQHCPVGKSKISIGKEYQCTFQTILVSLCNIRINYTLAFQIDTRNFVVAERVMRQAIPKVWIAQDAVECMMECVSEFISFITTKGLFCRDL